MSGTNIDRGIALARTHFLKSCQDDSDQKFRLTVNPELVSLPGIIHEHLKPPAVSLWPLSQIKNKSRSIASIVATFVARRGYN
jgi:hypothetical protein